MQAWRHILALGTPQLRQLAAHHCIEMNELQRLQCRAQCLFFWPLHAASQQTQTAVVQRQHFDQQAGLTPWACMQDIGGLVV
ncbi:hypothetical protein D9M71_822800 [compost metagenome]